MRRRQLPPEQQGTPLTIRLAWWAAFLATLALVFALSQVQQASASAPPALGPTATTLLGEADAESSEEADEEWEFEEECETFGEDEELEELCEEPGVEEGTPPECLLSSTEATVAVLPARETVRLSIRYTAHTPAAVKVAFRLQGAKGSLNLGEERHRFNRHGTLRASTQLSEAELDRAMAARSFSVAVQAVNTPSYCHRYLDQKLTVKRSAGGGLTWKRPAARAAR
jgi:hypothetical protein